MKVLFELGSPFLLAHGGVQVQIEQTKKALEQHGIEVEWLRRWDAQQTGDIIHFFGVPPLGYQNLARRKGLPLVNTVLFSEACNRPEWKLIAQGWMVRLLLAIPFGGSLKSQLLVQSFLNSDCNLVGLNAEKKVLQTVNGVSEKQIGIVPLGCEEDFLNAAPATRDGDYLICVATISSQKQSLKLAQMAVAAKTPVLFVGKPYSEAEAHWVEFKKLVDSSPFVRHQRHIENRKELISLLQHARGFVLYSQYENWSIAADEAAACGLPLLLPDQRWARERFGDAASYLGNRNFPEDCRALRRFFDACPQMPSPPRPISWREAVEPLIRVYQSLLGKR